jgi:transcriptional regulator with PAS, ATPase and Fis domain
LAEAAIDTDADEALTLPYSGESEIVTVYGGRIEVVGQDTSLTVGAERRHIGRSQRCDLVLEDDTVSKIHVEVQATPRGVRLLDSGSLNGTFIGEIRIVEVYLTGPSEFRCGATWFRFVPDRPHDVVVSTAERFGGLVGAAPEMLELFGKLRRHSPAGLSIIIHGETGTGKERVAQAIHEASPRRDKPFIPINCAAVHEGLLEAELFGHVRGAFTGADRARDGLLVEADGGTLFLDEVGEMSSAMQAKLLRVLENQEIRPVGSGRSRKVDVRLLFATHVDLRHAVNIGRFREDLYYRMAQVEVEVPPLRRRLADMPLLLDDILQELGRPGMVIDDASMSMLLAHSWPGNIRELRTMVRAALVESNGETLSFDRSRLARSPGGETMRGMGSYNEARKELDRRFYTKLYKEHNGNVSKIAKAAGKQRVTVRAALREIGLPVAGNAPCQTLAKCDK